MPGHHQAAAARGRDRRRALATAALALAACCCLASAFVAPAPALRREPSVALRSTGEYTGFVPDMQRRMLMNLVAVAASAVPVGVLLGGYIWYFIPQTGGGGGGGALCGDINGNPIKLSDWVAKHKPNDRELVQGLKGDATYLISTEDGIKDFGLNAVCTHLGCVVPWVRRASPQDSRLQTPSGAQVRPTPQGLQVPGVQSRPGTRCPLDLQAQSVAQAPLDVHVQGLPIARTLSQGPPVPLPSAQPLSGRSTPGQLPGHSPRARVPSPSGQGHSPQPLLVAAGQQMIPPQTPLAVARQQAQTPVAQTPQTPLAAARQQAQTPQTPLLAAERARAQTPQTAAELQAQAPPAQTPQTPLAAARQQAQAPTAQTPQTPALDAGQQAQASPAQTPLVDARQQATPQQAQQTTGASPAEAEAAEAAQGQGRGASRRGVRASLVRQDATDWMDPGPGRASLGLGLSRPSGEPPGRTPNRPRDPLWSPRPLPSPELPLNHSVSDSALTPRDSTQTQTTWSYASVSTAGASLSTGASAPLLPTSAPVMGPKRSSLAAPARQQRLASPRGSVSERPPSRSSLPPVQDPAAAKAPARGGAAEPQRRPPPSAEGEGLRHAASAPALTQAAVRGHEAELLPPLERPPSTGSGVGVRAHRGDGHAADVASPFKPGAAAALLPLGGRPPSPGRLGVDEEFVSLSGDTIFILKPAGHNKKKTPFEDYTVARFIGGQHRPKLVVGGQAFS